MAPEIVKYNGEEEYTEKVDCFSFGMFIYELLTLQQPFTGYETVKELILGKCIFRKHRNIYIMAHSNI